MELRHLFSLDNCETGCLGMSMPLPRSRARAQTLGTEMGRKFCWPKPDGIYTGADKPREGTEMDFVREVRRIFVFFPEN